MSRYIDADALLKEWKIELPKDRPIQGKQSEEFLAFMKKYENHPYYFAILSIYLSESADVVEVVRCKDCKFQGHIQRCPFGKRAMPHANGYCYYGERRGR